MFLRPSINKQQDRDPAYSLIYFIFATFFHVSHPRRPTTRPERTVSLIQMYVFSSSRRRAVTDIFRSNRTAGRRTCRGLKKSIGLIILWGQVSTHSGPVFLSSYSPVCDVHVSQLNGHNVFFDVRFAARFICVEKRTVTFGRVKFKQTPPFRLQSNTICGQSQRRFSFWKKYVFGTLTYMDCSLLFTTTSYRLRFSRFQG